MEYKETLDYVATEYTMNNEDVADLMFHAAVDCFMSYESDYPNLNYETALAILAADLTEMIKRREALD